MRIWLWNLTVSAAIFLSPLEVTNEPGWSSCWCCCIGRVLLLLPRKFFLCFFLIHTVPRLGSLPVSRELINSHYFPFFVSPLSEAICYILTPSPTLVHDTFFVTHNNFNFPQIFQSYISLFNFRDGDQPRLCSPSLPQDMSSHVVWDHLCNLMCNVSCVTAELRILQ